MVQSSYEINIRFLIAKGIELMPTGAMFTTHEFENENYDLMLNEYQDLHIHNKKTSKRHSVNISRELLSDNDFN